MIDLQNDCALNAVCAATELESHNVKNDILRLRWTRDGDKGSHVICIFKFKDRLRGYDPNFGTFTFPKNLTFDSHPTTIAKCWAKNHDFEPKVYKGEWYE